MRLVKLLVLAALLVFVCGRTATAQLSRTVQYSYDSLNRLIEARYPDRVVRYAYDPAGNRLVLAVEVPNPVPLLSAIAPTASVVGANGLTLEVSGSQFMSGSVVQWNGSARATTFVSPTTLSATIAAGDLAVAGPVAITVVNPAPGGGASNSVAFTINATATTPAITWANPAPILPGTPLTMLQLNATADVPGTFKYTPDFGAVLPVGTRPLSVHFTPDDAVNYTTADASVSITVGPIVVGTVYSDFDHDLKSDILWRHATQGDLWLWPMDGPARVSESFVRTLPDIDWEIRGLGDQSGDGKADILWRNKVDGRIYLWPMDGSTPVAEFYVATVDPAYDIVGTGDFDGDGKSDILWRHTTWGDVWVWLMDGATSQPGGKVYIDRVDPAYVVKGVGDLDADTKADIVWHHATTGEVWVWPMNGTTRLDQVWVGRVPDVGYQIVGVADHTGDGKADLLWHHATWGEAWLWEMDGVARVSETWVATVPETDYRVMATGDYDGDGMADILWHHATRGEVWVWLMDGTAKRSETWVSTVPELGYQIVK